MQHSDLILPNNSTENPKEQLKVLVIDDEERFTEELIEFLENNNFEAHACNHAEEGKEYLKSHNIDLLILDICLDNGVNGIDVLKEVHPLYPNMEIIIVSGHGDMDTVIEAMRFGAIDYLRKPFRHIDIRIAIERTTRFIILNQTIKSQQKRQSLISEQLENRIERKIIGTSTAMRTAIEMAMTAAKYSDTNVLITGESGTGKENIARMVHQASERRNNVFCAINSSAIPDTLLESEFFGHKKGSFTGAINDHKGFFEVADGGTLFLDEIADMPINLQAKMLRAIEEKTITRIGESTPIKSNFRIISATNHNVDTMVKDKLFRLDLLYRLNTLQIEIPPLRERTEDIEPIMYYYIEHFCKQFKKPIPAVDPLLIEALKAYSFPGNVRELRNLIERAIIISNSRKLDLRHFPTLQNKTDSEEKNQLEFTNAEDLAIKNKKIGLIEHEKMLIKAALEKFNYNQSAAARELGIQRMALVRKIQKYNIENKKRKF